MPHHALEITLTRPATTTELDQARRLTRLATNHDHTRLLTLTRTKTPNRALSRVRRALEETLPIDVLATHYPDTHGQIILNIDPPPATHALLQRAAARHGQDVAAFIEQSLTRALQRIDHQEAERLTHAMQALLATTTRERLLTAAARALTTPQARPC